MTPVSVYFRFPIANFQLRLRCTMSNQRRNWKLAVGNRKSANSNMKASGLDLLFLEVNNLEESLGFYQGLLGLELESFNPKSDPPMATLRAGVLKITLAQQLE